MPAVRPPQSLDEKALASKRSSAKKEFNKLTSEVDAEMAKVLERMAEKKAWSRLEEVKKEGSEISTAQAEIARRAAEAQERAIALSNPSAQPSQPAAATAADVAASAPESEAARLRKELDRKFADELAQANTLAKRAAAIAAKKATEAAEAAAAEPPSGSGGVSGLFGALFGGWGGSSATAEASAAASSPTKDEIATGDGAAATPPHGAPATLPGAACDSPPPAVVSLASLSPEKLEEVAELLPGHAPAVLSRQEEALQALRAQYKAAQKKVRDRLPRRQAAQWLFNCLLDGLFVARS